jgi:hypothetical protein
LISSVVPLRRKHLILELDPDSEPIEGSLRNAEGQSFEFIGWLGFSSALGKALAAGSPAASVSHGGQDTSAGAACRGER